MKKALMSHIHPMICDFQINLLNERSQEIFFRKRYDSEDEYLIEMGATISTWLTNADGERVFIKEKDFVAWTFDTKKQIDEMISCLTKLKGELDS